ncbi:MAG: hypothetical protein JO093_01305 [Acidobacteria bacterium]|nr:hypothetical protein [Acidobacteriota bacterium]MBV9068984.1 hypothetical protein [Acidobacteriota bacterium]MBV9184220.1 hypothetical protein [Acidobacteriota bacterium]
MGGKGGAYFGWVALGVIMALVMPLTAVVTAMSVQVVAEDSVPLLMLAVLAIISFAAHCLILFGGKLAHASKTYYYFTTKHTQLSQELAANHRLVRRRLKNLEATFIPYVHHWKKHNQTYEYIEAGPFDNEVTDLLYRHFPYLKKKKADDDDPEHA